MGGGPGSAARPHSLDGRRKRFRELHVDGCFVIPNPWDTGTARYLEHLGFKALATTSAGAAFAEGRPDGGLNRDEMLAHISRIVAATDLPVNADFQGAYADGPEDVASNVRLCVDTGVCGVSVEDMRSDGSNSLYDFELAVERIRAARSAIDESQTGVLLVARSECYLTGHAQPFEEALRRLRAFGDAGADVLFAPGVTKRDEIKRMVEAVSPVPLNVLVGSNVGLRMSELAEMGVRRISVGGALARSAWGGFMRAAKEIAEQGTFTAFDHAAPFRELNELFERGLAATG